MIIVLFLIIPLPTPLLDVLLVVNIGLSIMILMITMNISEALEFSIFPSLLLVTTLFRLGLNVSTTRQILRQGYAGEVIANFGHLITGGNIVIGVVIFLIIVLVQFIVITKGAERVAEVAARFTLDAMPGKQMAIDADLSSGLINEQDARERRHKIQKEADFYGAMDGATKIVKGDAIMSLLITMINFLGGVIIEILINHGEFVSALNRYSIVTIGDGLVSQLPALMISTATGMIVTRSVSEGSLNKDVLKQFKAQPRAIMTTGVILLFLAAIPNTPHLALAVGGGVLLSGGYFVSRRMEQERIEAEALAQSAEAQPETAAPSETDYYKDINNVYSLLSVEPVEMEFGYSLIPWWTRAMAESSSAGSSSSGGSMPRTWALCSPPSGCMTRPLWGRTSMSSGFGEKRWPEARSWWTTTWPWSRPIPWVRWTASRPLSRLTAFPHGGFCRKIKRWRRSTGIT